MDNGLKIAPYIQAKATNKMTNNQRLPKASINTGVQKNNNPSFTGLGGNLGKRTWLLLKNSSNAMKEITESTNAYIAAFGTGIIAPLIILASPGKGDKEDKDKKFFQSIRQPLSAILALGFQLPATYMVNEVINKLAYKTDAKLIHKFFDDEVLGSLIQDKKYIKKHTTRAEIQALEPEFNEPNSSLRKKLEDSIRNNYEEVGLNISDNELAKEVSKKRKKFLLDELVDRKYQQQIEEKCAELKGKNIEIKTKDLITDDIKLLIEHTHKTELDALEKSAKLSPLDKMARLMGFETKNLKI